MGHAPIAATVYELERLRCNLCGEVFEAEAPEGVGEKKYDESAAAMIALLKYGSGVPFYRLAGLEKNLVFRCRRRRSGRLSKNWQKGFGPLSKN